MPRALVARRVHFNAAHRLHNPAHSDEWNRALRAKGFEVEFGTERARLRVVTLKRDAVEPLVD